MISIVADASKKGGCHWDNPPGKVPSNEVNQEFCVGFAGPIAQTLFTPQSLGQYATQFAATIFQPDDILEKAGVAGWASTDLNYVIGMRRRGFPITGFQELEKLIRALLLRPSVRAAVEAIAIILDDLSEITGADAESVMKDYLLPSDFVGNQYVT